MKVRTRMLIVFLALGISGFIYFNHFINSRVEPVYLDPIEDDLVDMATLLSSVLATENEDGPLPVDRIASLIDHTIEQEINASIHQRKKERVNLHVVVTDTRGVVAYDSADPDAVGENRERVRDIYLTLKGRYGSRTSKIPTEDGGLQMYFYVASPIPGLDGTLRGVVSVGKPSPAVAWRMLEQMEREAYFGVTLAVVLGLIIAALFTLWVTKPIRLLTDYVSAVRDGRNAPPPRLGSSDIGRLGHAFDEMREAIEGKKYVEQYVQTLTHEIKSPLSAIKGAAELLQEDMPEEKKNRFLHNITTEAHRIQRVVDLLLELSALENRKTLNRSTFSLQQELREIAASQGPFIENRGLVLKWDTGEDVQVSGERFLIHQALANLLRNAVEFTPKGGVIDIGVHGGEVRIHDSGPGFPDYAKDRIYDRFYSLRRPETGKKSSGLGLSIAKQVAELHGAELSLENHPRGGAEAVFRFPAMAAK